MSGSDTSTALDATEPAFSNLRAMLSNSSVTSTGFMRPDAMLAIVLLSTGDDTSDRNICTGAFGSQGSGGDGVCDLIGLARNGTHPSKVCGTSGANASPDCNNYETSITPYVNFLQGFKGPGNSAQVKFFPVVASGNHLNSDCAGGTNAFDGARYRDMASRVGGQAFDICSTSIPTALTGIQADRTTLQLSFFTHFLFMDSQPDPASIVVFRNPGGDTSKQVVIPQDATNGWTFVGNITDQLTTSIGSPNAAPTLNRGSGWAVPAERLGHHRWLRRTASVQFNPSGTQNSSK